ncbi:uncharacterized protein F4822DRAFT_258794 [Hypoxylon trugodes]|uniref:uncharacterized protein n=1 Tax=Hypoxylon trugodes TaxID=326681 RepID=UPI0021935DF4|nr:uncharacterized protein F4822DRAFT_258794 [Hypoxylon trugodes]KAI1388806.1 hypothetical protein F4822DRAFT_258794 [Hypoxylon trugodes]
MAPHFQDEKKGENHQDQPNDPPPPYSPQAAVEAGPSTQPQQQPRQKNIPRQFPPAFSMYNESSFGQRKYMIGEHQSTPLYAVSLHSGWSGQPDVVLHNGPSDNRPPLAGVERDSWSNSATITLPVLPGSGTQAKTERLESTGGFGHPAYTFSVEAGSGNRREAFEWRHTSGSAVASLGGRSSGWKLLRLSTDAPSGVVGGGSGKFVGGGASSSDGKEVVAVWAWASGSLTKVFKFQFLGSGANGVLGERWAIMAVATALKIWDRERRARNSSAAGAGGGAGA